MPMRNENQRNQIYCEVPTLLNPATSPLLGMPVEGFVLLGTALGFDGLKWRPMRSAGDLQINSGKLSTFAKKGIQSAEQSYRGERSWHDASRHQNKRLAQVSYLLFPHRTDSLNNLVRLQELVGDIPFTVYSTTDVTELSLQKPLKNKLLQLSPDLVATFKAPSLDAIVEAVHSRGYGINLDLLHYQRLAQSLNIPADNSTFRALLPFIREVQFPVARTDFQLLDDQSQALLTILLNLGYAGPITPEINPIAFGPKILQAQKNVVKDLKTLIT